MSKQSEETKPKREQRATRRADSRMTQLIENFLMQKEPENAKQSILIEFKPQAEQNPQLYENNFGYTEEKEKEEGQGGVEIPDEVTFTGMDKEYTVHNRLKKYKEDLIKQIMDEQAQVEAEEGAAEAVENAEAANENKMEEVKEKDEIDKIFDEIEEKEKEEQEMIEEEEAIASRKYVREYKKFAIKRMTVTETTVVASIDRIDDIFIQINLTGGYKLIIQKKRKWGETVLLTPDGRRLEMLEARNPELMYPEFNNLATLGCVEDDKYKIKERQVELSDEQILRGYSGDSYGINRFIKGQRETLQVLKVYPTPAEDRLIPDMKKREASLDMNISEDEKRMQLKLNVTDIFKKDVVYTNTSMIYGIDIWLNVNMKYKSAFLTLKFNNLDVTGEIKQILEREQVTVFYIQYTKS